MSAITQMKEMISHRTMLLNVLPACITWWQTKRRMARQLRQLESMPACLLRDIGLPDLHRLSAESRRAALLAAIRDREP